MTSYSSDKRISGHAATLVSCRHCRATWLKRLDSLKVWNGACRSCAQRLQKSKPEIKQEQSNLARLQVIRQGGVPNARKFTKDSTSGSKNSNWKGGITPINRAIRTSTEYKVWRNSVYKRDSYTCQKCGKKRGKDKIILHAHHIMSFSEYPELRFDINNGETLCSLCHLNTPTFGGKRKYRV